METADEAAEPEEWELLKCLRRKSELALLTVRNAPLLWLEERALKDLIRKKQDEMREGLKSEERVRSGTGSGDHAADAADAVVLAGEASGILKTLSWRLQAVQDARAKILQGAYGICEGCGQTIEAAVLRVCPESRHCWECKKAQRKE